MELFPQKQGIKLAKSVMQVDSMDDELRNGLWNCLRVSYWDKVRTEYNISYLNLPDNKNIAIL